jgi:hypothetical protein
MKMISQNASPWTGRTPAPLVFEAIIALFVAVLVFGRQIGFFLIEENRYFYLWQWQDNLALMLDVLLLASALFGVSLVPRATGWSWASRAYNALFLLVLAVAALTLVPRRFVWVFAGGSVPGMLIWLAVAGVIGFEALRPGTRLVEVARRGCLIFSPLVVILGVQLAMRATWSTDTETGLGVRVPIPRQAASTRARTPIFVFVFDEWSYKRTTNDGAFLPEFASMRALSEQSFNFRQAWSYSTRSMHSLPAILFQTDQRIQVGAGQTYWDQGGRRTPTSEVPSLFRRPRELGYFTALQGFYLPYGRMLGGQVDYARSQVVFPKGEELGDRMALTAARNLVWWNDPFTAAGRGRLEAQLQSRRWYEMSNRLLDESLRLIDESPKGTIAFFHWSLPHGPFVFNPDGSYHGPYPRGNIIAGLHGTVDDYRRHLLYQDRVIGRLVEHFKGSGKYDDALLIFTADHSWRPDPLEEEENWKIDPSRRRVPLLVKVPGQTSARIIDKTVYNNFHLKVFIDHALRGDASVDRMEAVIGNLKDVPTPTGKNTTIPEDVGEDLAS